MKLTEKDMKLLAHLYHSNRDSLTQIAKKTGLSRIQVEYKMNKFQKEGIIEKFMTIFNYKALGYNLFVVLFIKLEKFSSLDQFTKRLEKSKHCISWGKCFGKYDLLTNLIFKNEEEFSEFLSEIISEKKTHVSNYSIIKPYFSEFQPLTIFDEKQQITFPIGHQEEGEKKIDEKDVKILKMLEENNRVKLVDIAKELGISAELALHRMRRLHKDGIVLGSRLHMRMSKLGYNYSLILLNIRSMSDELKERLINFSRKDKNVDSIMLSLFNPNCVIQVFHKTEDELKNFTELLKILLKDEIVDINIVLANEEDKINTLPFL